MPESRLERFWGSSCPRILWVSAALVVPSLTLTALVALVVYGLTGAQSPLGAEHFTAFRLSLALVVAPVIENAMVMLAAELLRDWHLRRWWVKPAVIGVCAGVFHVIARGSAVSFQAVVPFFFIASLIIHVRNKRCGFLGSAVFHAVTNAAVLGGFLLWT